MTSDPWHEVQEILLAALERRGPDRTHFLDRQCAGRPELRAEVERYLEAEDEVATFIEAPAVDLLATRSAAGRQGQSVGTYRLGAPIGHGGMSVVYEARRDDGTFEHSVAVKVLKRGLDTADILRRFRQERQILAQLDHPSIARILDGGTTDDGLPYLVMERVDGHPIDEACRALGLTIRERLELFVSVCRAVQVAHQNLVVHRDIKAANILVTSDGNPKLLDFGIAKLIPQDKLDEATRTSRDLRPMTPSAASPEQLLGRPVGTATDVYALGVLLYRLLTDRHPFAEARDAPAVLLKAVLETTPPRPSTAVGLAADPSVDETPALADERRGRRRLLRGDLDTLIAKAMHKEPARRYASAAELGDDIERYLHHEPLVARPDHWLYRTRLFVRRHPFPVAAALTLLLVSAGFFVVLARQLDHTEAARDGVRSLLDQFLAATARIDPSSPKKLTASEMRDVLDPILPTLDDVEPVDRAIFSDYVGRMYVRLGFDDEGRRLLDQSLDIRRQLSGSDRLPLAESLNNRALAAIKAGDLAGGTALIEEAFEVFGDLGSRFPKTETDLLTTRATGLQKYGDLERAEPIFREVLETRRRLYGPDHFETATAQNNLGSLLFAKGRPDEARPLFESAVSIRTAALDVDHLDTARARLNLGLCLDELNRPEEAIEELREALRIRAVNFDDDNPELARVRAALGYVLLGRETAAQDREARSLLESAHAALFASGPTRPETLVHGRNLVVARLATGDLDGALSLATATLEHAEQRWDTGHWRLATIRATLGRVLAARGDAATAERLLRESLPAISAAKGEGSRYTREVRAWLDAVGHPS